eukprot:snap_masked-scaffold_124-processed-gene-0.5-mRNA-1 protein AED:1.00 eAED:1.00 QI:0/0/0/0/1/1/2/0/64
MHQISELRSIATNSTDTGLKIKYSYTYRKFYIPRDFQKNRINVQDVNGILSKLKTIYEHDGIWD